MYINDKHMIERLGNWGGHPEQAWDWAVPGLLPGCSQTPIRALSPSHLNVRFFWIWHFITGFLQLMENRSLSHRRSGSFQTFAEVLKAFQKQYEYIFKKLMHYKTLAASAESRLWRYPSRQPLMDNCLKNGRDPDCWRLRGVSCLDDQWIEAWSMLRIL